MAKAKKVAFDFSAIVTAAIAGAKAQGSFVRSIVEARGTMPNGIVEADDVAACMAEIALRAAAEELTENSMDVYYSKGKTLLTCEWTLLLDAVGSGYGINGVTSRIIAAKKDKTIAAGGIVKAGRGKNKPKAAPMVAAAATEGKSPMHLVSVRLNDIESSALILRDTQNRTMAVADAQEFQAALKVAKAILGKYL
jgi:hypothetical protein